MKKILLGALDCKNLLHCINFNVGEMGRKYDLLML